MGTYGYISIIAMVCYGFMLLMFLTAKRNKIVNSFLVVLVGLLFWAGGSAFMRVHLWPSYEFWYQVSLLGILLLPYAYYCFILAFGGVKKSLPGKIYLAVMLICFVVNIRHGVFLGCPNVVEKNGLPTFVYEIKPTILVLFFPAGIFLIYLFLILVRICKANPNMKVQYEPVISSVLASWRALSYNLEFLIAIDATDVTDEISCTSSYTSRFFTEASVIRITPTRHSPSFNPAQ